MNNYDPEIKKNAREENVFFGIVGAFLFSLAGGILWYVFSRIGFLVWLSGFVGVVCAIKGYAIFGKKESVKGIIISFILTFFVLILAWYLSFATDLYQAYELWYENGDVDYMPRFSECVRYGYEYFEDADLAWDYIKDLIIGLILALLGSIGTVIRRINMLKNANAQPVQPVEEKPYSEETSSEEPENSDKI